MRTFQVALRGSQRVETVVNIMAETAEQAVEQAVNSKMPRDWKVDHEYGVVKIDGECVGEYIDTLED
jgi:hypothetical protein